MHLEWQSRYKCKQTNTQLEEITLSHCQINDEKILSLAVGLQSMVGNSLKSIKFPHNELTSYGFESMLESMEIYNFVKVLDVSYNKINKVVPHNFME